jgi:hypothetical protein
MVGLLGGLATLLAVVGAVALLYRALGGAFRLALRASQETAASGMAEVSQHRGDVTAMLERAQAARLARRDRRRHTLLTLLWVSWFVLPLLLGGVREAYAVAAVLWLVPHPGRR